MAQEPELLSAAGEPPAVIATVDSSQPMDNHSGRDVFEDAGTRQPSVDPTDGQQGLSKLGDSSPETLPGPNSVFLQPLNAQDASSQPSPTPNAPSPAVALLSLENTEQPQDPSEPLTSNIITSTEPHSLNIGNFGGLVSEDPIVTIKSTVPSLETPVLSPEIIERQHNPLSNLETPLELESRSSNNLDAEVTGTNELASAPTLSSSTESPSTPNLETAFDSSKLEAEATGPIGPASAHTLLSSIEPPSTPNLETALDSDSRPSRELKAETPAPHEPAPAPNCPTPLRVEQVTSRSPQPIDSEDGNSFPGSNPSGIFHGHEEKTQEEDVKLGEQQEAERIPSEKPLPALDRLGTPSTDTLSTLCSDRFDESLFTFQDVRIEYERDKGSDGILRLKPTLSQWEDFPSLLSFARAHDADLDGCFKIVLPDGALEALPDKPAQIVESNAFTPQLLRPSRIWRVNTKPTTGKFPSSSDVKISKFSGSAMEAAKRLSKLFTKSRNRQIRDVRYRVDVPAWSVEQRLAAGVPGKSPLHPLKGDKLDLTKAIIPGIHTPYVYESGPAFGATFQLHAEDFRLSSLNHLYKGRKIWIIIPSAAVGLAEEQLGRKESCSQFMRHRAEFVFPEKLNRLGIPFRLIDQSPGETIVILPDAYHEGFSTGYTLAEAKNYAEETWNTETYQPCDTGCQLATAIPGEFMRIIEDGEHRLDLCSSYSGSESPDSLKRERDEDDGVSEESIGEPPLKRFKWKGGGMSSTVTSIVF